MLAETVREAARRFGERPAIVAEDGWALSFADLDRLSDEAAAGLVRHGVREGDVVSLLLPSVPEHIVGYLATAKLGAVTAAVNPRLAPVERQAVLDVAGPVVVITTPELAPESAMGATVIAIEPASFPEGVFAELRQGAGQPPLLTSDPHRPIAVVFTSGTTGLPKGAVFTGIQLSFITDTDVGPEWGGGGKALAGSALAHLGPMTKLAGSLRRGSTQYLSRTWRASDTLRRISTLGIAAVGGVPAQLALMLRDPEFDRYDLSCVRAIVVGGGPATPALIREARARFGAPLAARYSCTEAGIGTGTGFTDPDEDAEVSVGRAQPGVSVRIIDGEGKDMSGGEVGEVVLNSPAVMQGYWRDRLATDEAFAPGGGVRTGDLGWTDEQGRLHLAGRARERYVRGGYNVYPMEVEGVLADHPDVSSIAIIGRPDPVMGEVGIAVVVPALGRPAPSVASLRGFAEGRLGHHKLPDEVVVVSSLPLTAMEKVDRRALEALLGGIEGPPGD